MSWLIHQIILSCILLIVFAAFPWIWKLFHWILNFSSIHQLPLCPMGYCRTKQWMILSSHNTGQRSSKIIAPVVLKGSLNTHNTFQLVIIFIMVHFIHSLLLWQYTYLWLDLPHFFWCKTESLWTLAQMWGSQLLWSSQMFLQDSTAYKQDSSSVSIRIWAALSKCDNKSLEHVIEYHVWSET